MNTALKILIVVTSNASMGDTGKPTGIWFEELSTPYYAFIDAGADVQIASIKGGSVPIDPRSQKPAGENPKSVDRFLGDAAAMAKATSTVAVEHVADQKYDAVFMPGGHGTMWDFRNSAELAKLVVTTYAEGRVVGAVCHGPAGLLSARLPNGRPLVEGKRVSAFTDAEEEAAGLTAVVPYLLETELTKLGAKIEKAPNYQAFAVADGNLVTGQNPASSEKAAQLVLKQAVANRAARAAAE